MVTVGVVGGTGSQGRGLALRFAAAGHAVTLGSRTQQRAERAAEEVSARLPAHHRVSGAANHRALAGSDVAVLAVPYEGHAAVLTALREQLAGKIVISCVNPLGFDARGPYALEVPEGSAAEQASVLLPDSRVVAAFHHVSARRLLGHRPYLGDEDVLVAGDDEEAKQAACELARAVTGYPGVDVGALRLARQLEQLIAVLISVNERYRSTAGIALNGLGERAPISG